MSTNPTLPTAAQLSTTRLKQWHQDGEALLTFENVRSWINAAGLALYNPRATQLPAPAPSMVEAVLGASNAAPTPADAEQPRALLARLIAEGAAVPLNLLGSPTGVGTDTPDFIAATAILPYIFTLRGDKSWKLPPATSGASKVSPLALNTYTLLTESAKGATPGLSASALATELGKEVTEAAVLRALTELWQHLRVLPIPQQDGAPTLWELTSARFTKQLKAGANAGQPTALSALVSLYLGQAIVATEAEIETFLSPLAARSRIRDVVHALIAARQVETIAVEGKTVLHVTGDLPAFLSESVAHPATHIVDGVEIAVPIDDIDHLVVTTEGPAAGADSDTPEPRIKKFVPTPRKIGTGFVKKLASRTDLSKPARKPFGEQPAERTRRPFTRAGSSDRPTFNKPWEEEKIARLAAASAPSAVPEGDEATESGESAPRKAYADRKPSFGKKPAFGEKRTYGDKPAFGAKRSFGDKPSFGRKPAFGSDRGGDARPPRRDFGDKPAFDRKRNFGDKPAFGAKRTYGDKPAFGAKRSFSSDRGGDSRPPRRDFGDKPSFGAKRTYGDKPAFGAKRTYGDKPSFGAKRFDTDRGDARPPRREFSSRPPRGDAEGAESTGPRYRKFDAPRTPRPFTKDRESTGGYAGKKREGGYAGKSEGGYAKKPYVKSSGGYAGKSASFGDKKPYSKSTGSYAGKSEGYKGKSTGYAGKSEGGYKGRSEGGYKGKSEGGYTGKSEGGYKSKSEGGYKDKSDGGYKGKSATGYKGKSSAPFAKAGKPASTFDKFKDNKKPFGKRPPARKWKPEEGAATE